MFSLGKNRMRFFSIVEMMTVVFVILLLITLLVPVFVNLKMNARSTICRGQLGQIHKLLTAYATENNGFLPNDDAFNAKTDPYPYRYSDLGSKISGSTTLYQYWTGHLLPYLDTKLPSYARSVKVAKDGLTRNSTGTTPPIDPLTNGWAVVDDAYKKGGYQDLKVFICPEIHANTYDISAAKLYNDVRVPRISQLCDYAGFGALNANYLGGGIPTTYLANDLFFGLNNVWANSYPSLRIDQINDYDSKVLIVEGGVADPWGPSGNGEVAPPYYMINTYSAYTGGALIGRYGKSGETIQKLSFVHDNIDEFWIMNGAMWFSYYFPSMWWGTNQKNEYASHFNLNFAGKANMVMGSNYYSYESTIGYDIVSYVNPYLNGVSLGGGTIFDSYLTAYPSGSALQPFIPFTDKPNDYHYLVGNMNVLMGDGSVLSKDQSWLCNNRLKISMKTK